MAYIANCQANCRASKIFNIPEGMEHVDRRCGWNLICSESEWCCSDDSDETICGPQCIYIYYDNYLSEYLNICIYICIMIVIYLNIYNKYVYPYGSKHCLRRYLTLQLIVNYTPAPLPKKVRLDPQGINIHGCFLQSSHKHRKMNPKPTLTFP